MFEALTGSLRRTLTALAVCTALAIGLVATVASQAEAGTTCSNKFHFHGSQYWHAEDGVYPYGSAWRWIWENQNNVEIGRITCSSP